jgi:phospholipid/cholesterol/gamma-HCH transport system substrate-binding protein
MTQALRLGLFIVAALLIFAGAVFLIGDKHLIFQHGYSLKAEFDNVAGLDNGAEVRVGGIHEGTVKQIILPTDPKGKVTVVMNLNNATHGVIKKDSTALIRTEGLVGDEFVAIRFGSPGAPGVRDGDTIGSEPPVEISDMIKKANGLLDTAQTAVQNVAGAAGNLNEVSSKINRGTGSIGALINDKSVYQHVNAAASDLQDDMEALKHNFLVRGFFKKRGYEDDTDLKAHAVTRIPEQPSEQSFEYAGGKLFSNATTAKLGSGKNLNEAGQFLQDHPFGLAVVAVYGSDKGETDKERTLTEARAAVVREYLANNYKFDDTRVKTIGLGKSPDPQQAGKVEILVYPASGGQADRSAATEKKGAKGK